ncbi:DMT family transporter [Ponticaulis sp.]|uniref:DMT family transporter n=1 Tax=Ponticaulis sp. TaxID=2020902 RepID=UPI000B6397C8|nr:DMT family transporter [Ponticaulis sp.]MAI89768.1 EamA family transporter [Ponticaulis sp.]OUX99449.1 MAG: EamA family transporter [Hyphomonadaceae bacterium TMED5]
MSTELIAIGLGLFSALTLALANLVVKATNDILVTRAVLSTSCALILAPFAFVLPLPTPALWAAIAVSVPVHFFYQMSMIRALHRGDLSLVFPVMRGLAPLLVAGGAFVFLDESLSWISLIGLFIATCAVIAFGFLQGSNTASMKSVSRAALFWAGMTAVGVMAYNVADARGVRLAENPLTFVVWLFMFDWIGTVVVALVVRGERFVGALKPVLKNGIAGGVLSVVSYGAALLALDMIEAARVTALRETAVVFGALMGWLVLKEGIGPRRIIASAVLVFGLALMQFGA